MNKLHTMKRFAGLAVILLLSSACSSEFMIRTMYADLGDSFVDDVHEYADFDRDQSEMIENVAAKLHDWHRTTQLPIYSQFLRDTASDSESGLLMLRENVENKLQGVEQAMQTMENAPWPMLGELFNSLTLDQIAQMEDSLSDELRDMQREMDRAQSSRGLKKARREQQAEIEGLFTDVLDVQLNKSQKLRIETMVKEWSHDSFDDSQLEAQWNSQFIDLLRGLNGGSVSMESLMDHLASYGSLHDLAAPERALADREILIDGLHDIFKSMDNQQQLRMQLSLNRYADLIDSL